MIRFLKRLLSRFGDFTPRGSPRFDRVPGRDEVLSRFIFSRGHFGRDRVKLDAFLPSGNPLETSVYRTHGLDRPGIRRIGDTIGAQGHRRLKAWGNVLAGEVFDVGLDVLPDNVPERHAAIRAGHIRRTSKCPWRSGLLPLLHCSSFSSSRLSSRPAELLASRARPRPAPQ